MGENGWLLIKHRDEYAALSDITKKDKSVLSEKTIAQMEKTSDQVWQHGQTEKLETHKNNRKITKILEDDTVADQPEKLSGEITALINPIYQIPQNWKLDIVVDGEILVLDDNGVSNFGKLQN